MVHKQKHIDHPMSLLCLRLRQGGRYAYNYFDMDGTSSTSFSNFHCSGSRHFRSADTRTGEAVTSGYYYSHKTIEGFSLNHISGVGAYGTLGNFQVMPRTGAVKFHSGTNVRDIYQPSGTGWESSFRHETEMTKAAYYKVKLDRYTFGRNRPVRRGWVYYDLHFQNRIPAIFRLMSRIITWFRSTIM